MGEVVIEVFEKVVRDGIKYLVKRTVNSIGKKIKEFFRDEDDDGVPDTEEPEFVEDDDEEISGGEETSGAGESGSELPTTSEPVRPPAETSQPAQTIGDIILMTPGRTYYNVYRKRRRAVRCACVSCNRTMG